MVVALGGKLGETVKLQWFFTSPSDLRKSTTLNHTPSPWIASHPMNFTRKCSSLEHNRLAHLIHHNHWTLLTLYMSIFMHAHACLFWPSPTCWFSFNIYCCCWLSLTFCQPIAFWALFPPNSTLLSNFYWHSTPLSIFTHMCIHFFDCHQLHAHPMPLGCHHPPSTWSPLIICGPCYPLYAHPTCVCACAHHLSWLHHPFSCWLPSTTCSSTAGEPLKTYCSVLSIQGLALIWFSVDSCWHFHSPVAGKLLNIHSVWAECPTWSSVDSEVDIVFTHSWGATKSPSGWGIAPYSVPPLPLGNTLAF